MLQDVLQVEKYSSASFWTCGFLYQGRDLIKSNTNHYDVKSDILDSCQFYICCPTIVQVKSTHHRTRTKVYWIISWNNFSNHYFKLTQAISYICRYIQWVTCRHILSLSPQLLSPFLKVRKETAHSSFRYFEGHCKAGKCPHHLF